MCYQRLEECFLQFCLELDLVLRAHVTRIGACDPFGHRIEIKMGEDLLFKVSSKHAWMCGVLSLDELLKIRNSLLEFNYRVRYISVAAASGRVAVTPVVITFRIVGVSK